MLLHKFLNIPPPILPTDRHCACYKFVCYLMLR